MVIGPLNIIFHFVGKLTFWKIFKQADEVTLKALISLGDRETDLNVIIDDLEKFICKVYAPTSNINSLAELRWWCFAKMQQQGDQLPPTKDSLYPALQRARLQTLIWTNSHIAETVILKPTDFGWEKNETGHLVPIFCPQDCAPHDILNLVKCGCKKTKCNTKHCKCAANNLKCTEMCQCEGDEEHCENVQIINNNLEDDDSCEEDEEMFVT